MLRKAGWNAVMFLWTKPIIERDSAALLWPYLRSMIRSGTVGTRRAEPRRVPADPHKRAAEGNFMTSPLWN
jgi:hypothetical protein